MNKFKTIRFNLRFHDKNETIPIRSLEDMKDHMCIDDLYEFFMSGHLERWLKVHYPNETEKAEALASIDKKGETRKILTGLFKKLFENDESFSMEEVNNAIDSFLCPEEIRKREAALARSLGKVRDAMDKEFDNYENLLQIIEESADNFGKVKSNVRTMLELYPRLFEKDFIRFFFLMREKCPLAIFAVLMDETWRRLYLPIVQENKIKLDVPDSKDGSIDWKVEPFFAVNVVEKANTAKVKKPAKPTCTYTKKPITFFPDVEIGKSDGLLEDIDPVALAEQIVSSFGITQAGNGGKVHFMLNGHDIMNDSPNWIEKQIIRQAPYEDSKGGWSDQFKKDQKVLILHCGANVSVRSSREDRGLNGKEADFALLDNLEYRIVDNDYKGDTLKNTLFFMEV